MDQLAVVADPQRRLILEELLTGERTVSGLIDTVALSQPAVSKHLRVLRTAGFVSYRQDGQRRWYKLEPEPWQRIDEWLASFRPIWARKLDALENHLDRVDPTDHRDKEA